jgi:hypothetical protein
MIGGWIEGGWRQGGRKSEAGRREVGDRSEEFYLNWHSNGIRNREFGLYLSKKIIKIPFVFLGNFCPAKVQNKIRFVMKRLGKLS